MQEMELRYYPNVELIEVLNEDFLSFGDMEVAAKFSDIGLTLYTSPQLKEDTYNILKNEPQTAPISDKLKKYIDNQVLIPTRYNKSLIRHLLFRTKVFFIDDLLGITSPQTFEKRSIAGFYDPSSNKIYLLLDNNINLLNFSYNDKISQLVVHEFSHYLSKNRSKEYFSLFENELVLFYSYFSTTYFELNTKYNKQIIDISKQILEFAKNTELGGLKSITTVKQFRELVYDKYINLYRQFKPYSKLTETKFESHLDLLAEYIFLANVNTLVMAKNFKKYMYIFTTILKTYVKGLDANYEKIKDTLFFQEFLIPSEIICIASIRVDLTKKLGSLM